MSFKSQKEIWEHLLAGGKIAHLNFAPLEYNHFDDSGALVNERGFISNHTFVSAEQWRIYTEPKKKEKITLYRYTARYDAGQIVQGEWRSQTFEESHAPTTKLLKTETKVIEVDE